MAYDGTLKFDTSMDSSGFQKDTNKLGDLVKGLGVFKLLEKGFEMVTASIDRAVSRYDALNKFPKVLELMGFGADASAAATKKLADGVQGLPTALDDVVSTAQRLTVLTGNLEMSVDATLALNNAFLASGSGAADASRGMVQYTQMLTKGTVDIISWRTLQETMGYALQKTAEAFGFAGRSAQNDLYAALKNGDITFEQFNAKVISLNKSVGGFEEMAKKSTGGINTAFTNMNTRIAAGVAEVISGIDKGFSQTRFKSIENIISSAGTAIKNGLTSVAGAFEVVASKADVLIPLLIGVGTAVTAWKIATVLAGVMRGFQVAAVQVALYAAQLKTASALDAIHTAALTGKEAIMGVLSGKIALASAAENLWNASKTKNTLLTIKDTAAIVASTVATTLNNIATQASNGSLTLQATAINTALAAKIKDRIATIAGTVAETARNIITGISTGSITLQTIATAAQTIATGAATVATGLLSAALVLLSGPIGLIIAGVALLVIGIIALVSWLNKESEEYKKQKEEVKALAEAQDELADSMQDSSDTFKSSTAGMEANAKVSQKLVGNLKNISSSSASAEDKHRRMANTVAQLNSSVEGLNIAYDKETGAITNLNTGQEISIGQLEELVNAKAELAQANAWAERANELVTEQVKLLEEQEVILNKIDEINANEVMHQTEKDKLIKDLTATYDEYGVMVEDVQGRIDIANEKVEASDTSMAESVVASHGNIEQSLTSNGESIEDLAAQWNVSADEIIAAMERENISLDDWVAKQESAWAEYEASVKERTQGVINSFKEIPGEYDKSATEMLAILISNKERYAEWETAMEEITRQLGPAAAEEFAKLGPEATSAMQEILDSAELMDEYRDVFGVKLDEVTGLAVEDWNDPSFIGAPSDAIDSSAQMITENTALDTAVTDQVTGAKDTMQTAVEEVDFSTVGQSMAADIVSGITNADLSGITTAIANAITSGTSKVTSATTSLSTSVQSTLKTMSTQSQSVVTQMMTAINSAITSRAGTIKASITSMGSGITAALTTSKAQSTTIVTQMMTDINSTIVTRSSTVKASMTACANGVITALTDMKTKATASAEQMMTGINSAIVSRTSTVRASATAAASAITTAINEMVNKGETSATQMMTKIGSAITTKTPTVKTSAATAANSIVDGFQPMIAGAEKVTNSMMDGMYKAMQNKAKDLYALAREIANKIRDTMADALDVNSPSRVMIKLFEFVMMGIYEGMDGMAGMLFREADFIADGIAEHLALSPDVIRDMVSQMQAVTEANQLGGVTLTRQFALAGAGGGTKYTTSLTQNITTPKPLSASEMTREGQDLLRRSRWQLP